MGDLGFEINSIARLRMYFEIDSKPLGNTEFRDFWESLSVNEKVYYRSVNLKTGTLPS